jgi:hypothetical protein
MPLRIILPLSMKAFVVPTYAKWKCRSSKCRKFPALIISGRVQALEKAGFRIVRQGKHIVMSDGSHFITIPRHNPVNALTMGGIVKDAGISVEEFRCLL